MNNVDVRTEYNLLYVDDEKENLFVFKASLDHLYNVFTAESGRDALNILYQHTIHVIFVDQRMPEMNGIQLLGKVSRSYPDTIRVLVTAYSDIDVVIDAINKGSVYRYIRKPWDNEEIQTTIKNAIEIYELRKKNLAQNRLLRQKVAELNFLTELNLELNELTGRDKIVLKVLTRLQEELKAKSAFYCEKKNNKIILKLPEASPENAQPIVERLNREPADKLHTAFTLQTDNQNLYILPLNFQEHYFGLLIFKFSGSSKPDQSVFLFSKAAANVAASALYSSRVHREKVEKEKFLILGQTASMIVHDLKGPMTTIIGFINLLRKDLKNTDRQEYCSIIIQEINRLVDMIEELLSFSRGKIYLRTTPINLKHFIQETLDLFKLSFKKENISIYTDFENNETIYGDKKKLKKVIINLLSNARETLKNFNGERRVWIKTCKKDSSIEIRVINSGRKIPEEIIPRLFDPFYTFGKKEGTGLGLAICKNIIEEHRGKIEVQSTQESTAFIISLPLLPADI